MNNIFAIFFCGLASLRIILMNERDLDFNPLNRGHAALSEASLPIAETQTFNAPETSMMTCYKISVLPDSGFDGEPVQSFPMLWSVLIVSSLVLVQITFAMRPPNRS
jgi:hypothetical protein